MTRIPSKVKTWTNKFDQLLHHDYHNIIGTYFQETLCQLKHIVGDMTQKLHVAVDNFDTTCIMNDKYNHL